MKISNRLQAARRQVQPLLAKIAMQDLEISKRFPRPIDEIALLCHGQINVSVIPQEDMTDESILKRIQGLVKTPSADAKLAGKKKRVGFLYCHDNLAFIFYDPRFGDGCSAFTMAHELGHLFLEYLPILESAGQGSLFDTIQGNAPDPKHLARRDTFVELNPGVEKTYGATWADEYMRRAERSDFLREVKANAFAAELLAPFKEVQKLVADISDEDGKIEAICGAFGLSKHAASIRLKESVLPENSSQNPIFNDDDDAF